MIDCGSHIEETIAVFRDNGLPLDPQSIAESVLDTVFAQGGVTVEELDGPAMDYVVGQVEYLLTPAELADARRRA